MGGNTGIGSGSEMAGNAHLSTYILYYANHTYTYHNGDGISDIALAIKLLVLQLVLWEEQKKKIQDLNH